MRTFGLGGLAGCHDILVKSVRIVDGDGAVTTLAHRARLPFVLRAGTKFTHCLNLYDRVGGTGNDFLSLANDLSSWGKCGPPTARL